MTQLKLRDQILHFVNAFLVVEEHQIMMFFKNQWTAQAVASELRYLKTTGKLIEHPQQRLSTVRNLPAKITEYDPVIRALRFMLKFDSAAVNDFLRCNYPNEIAFVVENRYFFVVTVFDHINWLSKYSMIPSLRKKSLPLDEEDTTLYVAVVPDIELIGKIKDLGFNYYAIVDHKGNCQLVELE